MRLTDGDVNSKGTLKDLADAKSKIDTEISKSDGLEARVNTLTEKENGLK